MALTSALNMTLGGMMATELRTGVSSQNITNADKAGYTRKNLEVQYMTTGSGSVPVSGIVLGSGDKYLSKALIAETSDYQKKSIIGESLDYYVSKLGSTSGTNTLSSYLDDMYARLQYIASNPETAANKAQVVTTADNLASWLRNTTSSIQAARSEAEQKIATSITTINDTLTRIAKLNEKITNNGGTDASLAEYIDQRELELQNLSSELDIQYYYTSNNRLEIFTRNGQTLLGDSIHQIDYTTTNNVSSSMTYPTNFSAIDLDGVDLTSTITGGKLGGYIALRDDFYVDEQAKLDEFAGVLQTQVNSLLNTGASVPPPSQITGSLSGLTAGTAFTATGSIRVAVMNSSGAVVNYSDINLGAMTTVSNVLTALNGVAGITATINAAGKLSIAVSPTTNGVAINPLASAVTSSSGESFSQYFGLNDLFTGTSAADINVSAMLRSNPQYLSVGKLSSSATLAVGDIGVTRGDGSVAKQIADLLDTNVSFAAAGNFSAQSNSLQGYAQLFIADAASNADQTQREADAALEVHKASLNIFSSQAGVNVDEETAKLLQYQNHYQAAAKVVSTIQEMLQAFMDAIR